MIGAIAGDIAGSVYEHAPARRLDFELFPDGSRPTDDSVLTVAVAHAILDGVSYADALREFGRRYPHAGYGRSFFQWLFSETPRPYNSWGNGSAMRVSPVAWLFGSEDEVLEQAADSAACTHDHPEGIKGAQAAALAIFLARHGAGTQLIRDRIAGAFGYDLTRSVAAIRPGYGFDVSCQGSVPEAIICALEADSWEAAVRNAISLGGDADTQACIAGAIAEARCGLPTNVRNQVLSFLPDDMRAVCERFSAARLAPGR